LRRRLNAAALLVSGGHPYSLAIPTYYDPPRPSPEQRSGVSRLVSGGLDVTREVVHRARQWSVADPDPWSCLPACEHSFERDLIPAHYTCRSCSPVGWEARTANSDFTNPPFIRHGFRPHTSFGLGLATSSTSFRVTNERHTAPSLSASAEGSDARCLVRHLRLCLLGRSYTTPRRYLPLRRRASRRRVRRCGTMGSSDPFPAVLPRVP
jgi:hypothetical protein